MELNVSKILNIIGIEKFSRVKITKCKGFSKNTYKISFIENKKVKGIIIKRSLIQDLRFYKGILVKQDLNSPQMLGYYKNKKDLWIITEFIPTKKSKEKDIYMRMAKWLLKKDRILSKRRSLVDKSFNKGDNWWKIIKINRNKKLLPQITYKRILNLQNKWKEINSILMDGPQTICHNDFEPKNTLMSNKNQFYVIDWTNPKVGSYFIDMARLVNNTPPHKRNGIIDLLKKEIHINNFDYFLEIARIRDYLSVFTALCNHINKGYKEEIDMKKFSKYAKILSRLSDKL